MAADKKLVAALRLLFDGLPHDTIAASINAVYENYYDSFNLALTMQEQRHCYSAYFISPGDLRERIEESGEEVFVGTDAELQAAAQSLFFSVPDGIYETMGYHFDDKIAEWRKEGLVVKAPADPNNGGEQCQPSM